MKKLAVLASLLVLAAFAGVPQASATCIESPDGAQCSAECRYYDGWWCFPVQYQRCCWSYSTSSCGDSYTCGCYTPPCF